MKSHLHPSLRSCLALLLVWAATPLACGAPEAADAALAKAAAQIDARVGASYKRQNLTVSAPASDAVFLRRAFLVAIGRIPTAEEARFFLENENPSKRRDLVKYLVNSPGYASHMSNWAFDLLRLTDRREGAEATNEPYRHWVRNAIDGNMPWNEFVHRLLSAEGDGWDKQTAAVGYYTRDRGMPLDNIANSMRIFLGSHMECAQCHDDPYDGPEQSDFYQLAAFTHGQGVVKREQMSPLWEELGKDQESRRSEEYRVARVIWDKVYGLSLAGSGEGRIALPADYKNRDGQPGEVVGARTPFGRTIRISERRGSEKGRKQLADWVTTHTDKRFAIVIANRMWSRVMGHGLFEPIDDFVEPDKTANPELVTLLGEIMVSLNYDLRAFQQVLLSTGTFQFVASTEPTLMLADNLRGRQILRLSAEQIWDSLVTLSVGDPDKLPKRGLDERIIIGGKPVLLGKKTMSELSAEVLALNSERELRKYFADFLGAVRAEGTDQKSGDDSMAMNAMKAAPLQYGGDSKVRASELPSPAPRGHFLYVFGQSDRQVVEAATREPNVGQVLSLMNGFVEKELVANKEAHIYKSLAGSSTPQERIRRIYLAILARPPSEEELGWMLAEVTAAGDEGYRNIISALVMSSEFLFLQ
jgi:hypothetical protein